MPAVLTRIERGWRVIATAIAFTVFGLAGLLLRLLVFPLLHLLGLAFGFKRTREIRIARLTVHITCKAFIALMVALGILRYTVTGEEKLNRSGLLLLANHPTLLDVVFLLSLVPNADCVVKASLARNPFTRGPIRATNYICNDIGPGMVDECIASLNAGSNFIIFPEGTRTPVIGAMSLQRGAAHIAIRGERIITPIKIRCVPRSLTKGLPWWKVPPRRMIFTIDVHDDIAVAPFIAEAQGEASLATRYLNRFLLNYFSTEGEHHAGT